MPRSGRPIPGERHGSCDSEAARPAIRADVRAGRGVEGRSNGPSGQGGGKYTCVDRDPRCAAERRGGRGAGLAARGSDSRRVEADTGVRARPPAHCEPRRRLCACFGGARGGDVARRTSDQRGRPRGARCRSSRRSRVRHSRWGRERVARFLERGLVRTPRESQAGELVPRCGAWGPAPEVGRSDRRAARGGSRRRRPQRPPGVLRRNCRSHRNQARGPSGPLDGRLRTAHPEVHDAPGGRRTAQVVRSICRRAAAPLVLGLLAGLAGAAALGRTLRAFLVGVEPFDAATLMVVAALLAAVVLVASLVPARRAARVDPLAALRCE